MGPIGFLHTLLNISPEHPLGSLDSAFSSTVLLPAPPPRPCPHLRDNSTTAHCPLGRDPNTGPCLLPASPAPPPQPVSHHVQTHSLPWASPSSMTRSPFLPPGSPRPSPPGPHSRSLSCLRFGHPPPDSNISHGSLLPCRESPAPQPGLQGPPGAGFTHLSGLPCFLASSPLHLCHTQHTPTATPVSEHFLLPGWPPHRLSELKVLAAPSLALMPLSPGSPQPGFSSKDQATTMPSALPLRLLEPLEATRCQGGQMHHVISLWEARCDTHHLGEVTSQNISYLQSQWLIQRASSLFLVTPTACKFPRPGLKPTPLQ